jgi:hypothetical protein
MKNPRLFGDRSLAACRQVACVHVMVANICGFYFFLLTFYYAAVLAFCPLLPFFRFLNHLFPLRFHIYLLGGKSRLTFFFFLEKPKKSQKKK